MNSRLKGSDHRGSTLVRASVLVMITRGLFLGWVKRDLKKCSGDVRSSLCLCNVTGWGVMFRMTALYCKTIGH